MFSFPFSRATIVVGALLICCGVVNAQQEKPASQIAALLPPMREISGLQLQITDAGFGSVRGDGGFFFSYDVTAQNKDLNGEKLRELVDLTSLFAPDGTPLMNTGYDGKRIYSSEVSPLWKSVRAEFEMRNLAMPDSATGHEISRREFKATKLPALPANNDEETKIESKIELVTARGSRLKLIELTRKRLGDKSVVVAHWQFTAPLDAPDAEADIKNAKATFLGANGERVRDFGGNPLRTHDFGPVGDESAPIFQRYRNGEPEIQMQLLNVPDDTQTIAYSFDLVESARQWREIGAFERVSFDIPVAALWKIAPLAPQIPRVAAVKARNESFEAIWEMREPDYAGEPQARLWLRDLAPAPKGEMWTLKGATLPEKDGQTRNLLGATQSSYSVLHTDNSLADANESSVAFPLYRPENLADKTDVTVTAQRARTILSAHVLPLVPLPKRNDVIEFGPKEIFDGVWYLRRIIWVDDESLKDDVRLSGGAALMLTFDIAPGAYLAEDEMQLKRQVFYDEKGTVDNSSSTFDEGDPAEKGHEKDRITMILSPPSASSKSFGGNFQIFQRVWNGPVKTLILPDVPVKMLLEETARN